MFAVKPGDPRRDPQRSSPSCFARVRQLLGRRRVAPRATSLLARESLPPSAAGVADHVLLASADEEEGMVLALPHPLDASPRQQAAFFALRPHLISWMEAVLDLVVVLGEDGCVLATSSGYWLFGRTVHARLTAPGAQLTDVLAATSVAPGLSLIHI